MSRRLRAGLAVLAGAAAVFIAGQRLGQAQPQQQPQENLLVIGRFDIPSGRSLNEAVAEATQWVKDLRATGEFRSVRLYMHNWGPELSVYVIHEPRSWQSIKNGYDKLFAARPDLMTAPFKWAGHSDNILTEIAVP